MSGNKTPLQVVNEQHGGKEKLVDKLVGLIEKGEEGAEDIKERLRTVSNQKLLRLLEVAETVKEKYGSTEKLTQVVADALGRAKDADYVKRLSSYSPARLLDLAKSLAKKARAKAVPSAEAKGAKAAKSSKAAPADKKTAAKAKAPAKGKAEKAPAKKPAKSKKE
jgi:hypothetical protein